MLVKYLEQLTSELELAPIGAKDNKGFFNIALNDAVVISAKELDPGFHFTSLLVPCPEKNKETFFIFLMKANFLGLATGGSVIGMDFEEKFLTLSRTIPYDVNYKSFKESLEEFANYLDFWRQEIARYQKEEERTL